MEFLMLFIVSLIITIAALLVMLVARKQVRHNNIAFRTPALGSALAAVVFGLSAVLQCFTQVPAGHVGVVDFFGVVSEKTIPAGINLVNPLADVIKYSIQTKEHKEVMQVLSREGTLNRTGSKCNISA